MVDKAVFTVVPADNEEFDLEVDYDVDPLEVVRSAGHDPKGWKFLGPARKGRVIERVKLVRLGYVRSLAEAGQKANVMGCCLMGGHGQEPFKVKYPRPDGKGPVIFGGSQWQGPRARPGITYLDGFGGAWSSPFHWASLGFDRDYRWAVGREQK